MTVKNFVVKNGLDTPALKITGLGSVTVTGYLTRASDGTVGSTATIPNSGLTNSAVTIGSTAISLGASSATLAGLTSVTATTFSGNLTGNVTGAVTGNASTATALQTARTINGVSFDGTANITVTAAAGTLTGATLAAGVTGSSLTSVGTLANLTVTNTIVGTIQKTQNIVGGNSTTLLGSIPYQSNVDTTTLLSPNTTTTKQFLSQTGTGTNGAIPAWAAIANGDVPTALTGKTYNGLTLTAAATGFTIAGGTTSKTLTVSNTLTLAGTDSSTLNIGSGGTLGSAAFTASTAYLSSAVSHTQHGYFNNVWLTDSNNSHHLRLNAGGNDLTANRLLNIFVNDSDRTLNLLGSFEFSGGAGTTVINFGSGGTVSYSTHTHTGSTISALDAADITTGALAVGVGGTGTSTAPTQGGFIYASSASSYASVAGTAGYFVKAGGTGAPTFAASTGSGSVVLDTSPSLTNAAITSAWIRPGYVSFTTSNFDLGTITYSTYEGKIIAMDSASAQTITVNNTSVPVGTTLTFVKMGTGSVTIVDGTANTAATPGLKFRGLYSVVSLTKISESGTDTWLAYGDLSA